MPDEQRPFDPQKHMRKIRTRQGQQDYLDVKFRVLWLRAEHPDAQIITELVEADDGHAIFRATISYRVPVVVGRDGGVDYLDIQVPADQLMVAIGTGHGSETREDFDDFFEKAETKAIGRACAALGFGTEGVDEIPDAAPAQVARHTMADEMSEAARYWFGKHLPLRGFRVDKPLRKWGDPVLILTENKRVDVDAAVDQELGLIDGNKLRQIVEDLPEMTPPEEAQGRPKIERRHTRP